MNNNEIENGAKVMLAAVRNTSMNHYNGDLVREQWAIGIEVFFKPKGFLNGKELKGVITGHLYVNVLIVKSGETEWFV